MTVIQNKQDLNSLTLQGWVCFWYWDMDECYYHQTEWLLSGEYQTIFNMETEQSENINEISEKVKNSTSHAVYKHKILHSTLSKV